MKTNLMRLLIGLAASLTLGSWAQETATVMPKGVFRIRAVGAKTSPITDIFNNNKDQGGLLDPLNRNIDQQTITQGMPSQTQEDLGTIRDVLEFFVADINEEDTENMFGVALVGDAGLAIEQAVFAAEYGITERFSVGVQVHFRHVE